MDCAAHWHLRIYGLSADVAAGSQADWMGCQSVRQRKRIIFKKEYRYGNI